MSEMSLNKMSLLVFALLRILEAVREVLSEVKGRDNVHAASLEETSTRLVALSDELHRAGSAMTKTETAPG